MNINEMLAQFEEKQKISRANLKLVHKLITIKRQLKPVCDPTNKMLFYRPKNVLVNCKDCLAGRKAQ